MPGLTFISPPLIVSIMENFKNKTNQDCQEVIQKKKSIKESKARADAFSSNDENASDGTPILVQLPVYNLTAGTRRTSERLRSKSVGGHSSTAMDGRRLRISCGKSESQ